MSSALRALVSSSSALSIVTPNSPTSTYPFSTQGPSDSSRRSAREPGAPHDLLVEHVEVNAQPGGRHGCSPRQASRLEVAVGALKLSPRVLDVGGEEGHPPQEEAVLGIVGRLGQRPQESDGVGEVAPGGQFKSGRPISFEIRRHTAILSPSNSAGLAVTNTSSGKPGCSGQSDASPVRRR